MEIPSLCPSSCMPSSLSPSSPLVPLCSWMLWAAAAAAAEAAESARCAASAMRRLLSAPRASPSQSGSPRWLLSAFFFLKRDLSLIPQQVRREGRLETLSPPLCKQVFDAQSASCAVLCLPCAQPCSSVGRCSSLPEAEVVCVYRDGWENGTGGGTRSPSRWESLCILAVGLVFLFLKFHFFFFLFFPGITPNFLQTRLTRTSSDCCSSFTGTYFILQIWSISAVELDFRGAAASVFSAQRTKIRFGFFYLRKFLTALPNWPWPQRSPAPS